MLRSVSAGTAVISGLMRRARPDGGCWAPVAVLTQLRWPFQYGADKRACLGHTKRVSSPGRKSRTGTLSRNLAGIYDPRDQAAGQIREATGSAGRTLPQSRPDRQTELHLRCRESVRDRKHRRLPTSASALTQRVERTKDANVPQCCEAKVFTVRRYEYMRSHGKLDGAYGTPARATLNIFPPGSAGHGALCHGKPRPRARALLGVAAGPSPFGNEVHGKSFIAAGTQEEHYLGREKDPILISAPSRDEGEAQLQLQAVNAQCSQGEDHGTCRTQSARVLKTQGERTKLTSAQPQRLNCPRGAPRNVSEEPEECGGFTIASLAPPTLRTACRRSPDACLCPVASPHSLPSPPPMAPLPEVIGPGLGWEFCVPYPLQ
ncbi:hypothetical protein SKAU_G00108200 [Synaphobranchus kaupii]|uniref:Uncharacterized protein n=1 Tax=Synaphobranchus kaupii TaxID=118154 RepID=A0A9Q1G0K5_SYNKA|nr:hypothetical protein SKAU_G00108200 [Synaphobranchus kaupii]